MKRIDTSTASEDENGSGKDGFTDGDPNAVPPVPATVVNDDWFNNVQEEICNAIEEQGITLDAGDKGQLSDAIQNPASVTTASVTTQTASITKSGGVGGEPKITFNASGGTQNSPTQLLDGGVAGTIDFRGRTNTGTLTSIASLACAATDNITSSAKGSEFSITVTQDNSTSTSAYVFAPTRLRLPSGAEYSYNTKRAITSYESFFHAASVGGVVYGISPDSRVIFNGGGTAYLVLPTMGGQQSGETLTFLEAKITGGRTSGAGTCTAQLWSMTAALANPPSGATYRNLSSISSAVSITSEANYTITPTSANDRSGQTIVLIVTCASGSTLQCGLNVEYSYEINTISGATK